VEVARRWDITSDDGWFIGEHKILEFTIYQQDNPEAVEDISGWNFRYTVKTEAHEAPDLLDKASGSGIAVTDGPLGKGQIIVDAVDIADGTREGTYEHGLMRTDAGSEAQLLFGEVFWHRGTVA
jgi:hypothetical protein